MRHLMALVQSVLALLALALALPAAAQITSVDPNSALGNAPPPRAAPQSAPQPTPPPANPADDPNADLPPAPGDQPAPGTEQAGPDFPPPVTQPGSQQATYRKDDLLGAAEGVFGKGAEGLAKIIEDILKDQGEPNAYIAGREASGALVVGLRYGSGTLMHKVEGEMPAYWTGPSIGFDAGANAAKTFVLVYNLYDSEDLYKRFPAGEGSAYFVGGFTASYLRRGDVVLIPIRLGVGVRLGANVGYMKFSKKQRWLPF